MRPAKPSAKNASPIFASGGPSGILYRWQTSDIRERYTQFKKYFSNENKGG